MNIKLLKISFLIVVIYLLFAITAVIAIQEIEPNNSPLVVQQVTIPATISGKISTSENDTADWYMFNVPEQAKITITIEQVGDSSKGFFVYLYNAFRLELITDSLQLGNTLTAVNTIVKAGNYLVEVNPSSDFQNASYTLTITTSPIDANPQLSITGEGDVTLSRTRKNANKLAVNAFNFVFNTTCTAISLDNSLLKVKPSKFILGSKKSRQALRISVPFTKVLELLGQKSSEFVNVQVFCDNEASAEREVYLFVP